MTMLEDDDMVVQALRAGARGYLVKGAAQREILDTIRGVHAGQAVIGADIARRLGGLVGGSAPEDPFPDLTEREREILDLLAGGATTTQIADRLGLSPQDRAQPPLEHLHQDRGDRPHPGGAQGAGRRPPARQGAVTGRQPRAERPPAYEPRSITKASTTNSHSKPSTRWPAPHSQKAA